jgi:putative ABC transport system permease protein
VLISLAIALVIGWFGGNLWLQEFAYSGGVSIWTMVVAGLLSILIAWVTIGFQTIRAATSNPVDAIKYE